MIRLEESVGAVSPSVVGTPSRLLRATALVVSLFTAGTVGYMVVEGADWWTALFMTVITITTVGFAEQFPLSQAGQLLTMALLIAGLGIFFFLASEIGRSIMEGEFRHYLGRVRRSRMIERMSGHEIVCGYGRMGRAVVDELRHAGRQVVVVDTRVARMQELAEHGLPTVSGDATLEATLLSANAQHARGLVSCVNDDAHNVYRVLTARSLNPDLFIVARATEEGAERRILQAGANRVVNPYHLGGARLAHLVVKPAIVNFFDASVDGSELQLDQTPIGENSSVAGQTLAEANIRQRWGLSVVAVQRRDDVAASPPADFRLQVGDLLVVFGSRHQIQAFDRECG
ncbi:MAG: potassium channel protein [Vicinamibacterales bacterium]|nr:potassium channel protein [Vicinamibacterales bacterium]